MIGIHVVCVCRLLGNLFGIVVGDFVGDFGSWVECFDGRCAIVVCVLGKW